jgi:hypothetical protein
MEFKPGDTCNQSGIYRVEHDPNHVGSHEVTVVYGEEFPPCRGCGHHPRFTLVRDAVHLRSHEYFKH